MTTLQEAARKALEALKTCSYGDYSAKHVVDPSFDGDAVEAAIESLKAALAQQGEQQPVAWYEYNQDLDAWFLAYGHNPKAKTRPLVFGDTAAPAPQAQQMEPTDDQLVKGVKAMRLFVTKNSVADFKLGYMAALAAAPAPQAQDKSDNYLSGYCTGRTDLLKEQSAQPVAHYDKTEMNAFVQDLYNKKMQEGKHGHYETMFHVVHKAIERADGIREVK